MKRELRDKWDDFYGNVGEVTPFEINGQYLQVGDVVKVYDKDDRLVDTHFVCKNNGEYFIMGIRSECDNKTGEIKNFIIKLDKKYYEVENNEMHYIIKMINIELENNSVKTLKDYTNNELLDELSKRTNVFVNLLHTTDETNIYTVKVEH